MVTSVASLVVILTDAKRVSYDVTPFRSAMEIFCGIVNGAADRTTTKGSEISVFLLTTLGFAILIAKHEEIIYDTLLHACIPYHHKNMLTEAEPQKCCFEKSSVDQHDGHAAVFNHRNHSRDPLDELVSMVPKFSCALHFAMDSLFSTMAESAQETLTGLDWLCLN